MRRLSDCFQSTSFCGLANTDEKTCAHSDRLLMTSCKAVIVSRFEIPAEAMSAGGPEHEISGNLSPHRIAHLAFLFDMNPLGPIPSMNSVLRERVHGFLNSRSVSHSVELRV